MAITYKNYAQMIEDEDFLQAEEDLLNKEVLNRPHKVLSNNLDLIVPSLDYLAQKMGVNKDLARIDNIAPSYSSAIPGYTTKYIRNGQSLKEAAISLDKAIRDLHRFIKSKSSQPATINPFLVPGEGLITGGGSGEAKDNWFLVGDQVNEIDIIEPSPVCRSGTMSPRIYLAGYANPRHIVGFDARRASEGKGWATMWQSFDGGLSWQRVREFLAYSQYSWSYLHNWTGAYKRTSDGLMEFGFGMGRGSQSATKYYGEGYYDTNTNLWAFTRKAISSRRDYYHLDIRRSKATSSYSIGAWLDVSFRHLTVGHFKKHFNQYSSESYPSEVVLIKTPDGSSTRWDGKIVSPSIVYLANGHILVAFGAKVTPTSKYRIYISRSVNGGATFSLPVQAFTPSQEYDYTSPHIIELTNGGVAMSFTTNENQASDDTTPRYVKCVVSSDRGYTWRSKVTIFQQTGNTWTGDGENWPTSKLMQFINGEVVCFIERLQSYYDRRIVRVGMRIEV
jgi:hypothetical protein